MTLTNVEPQIIRDRWGRPLITPPDGGKPIAYTRATTLAGAIEDLNGLIKWKIGRAILGLVDRPDLLLSAAAHRDDKQKLYQIAEDAAEAGGASSSATIGTALHAFVEKINHGLPTGTIPDAYKADVAAYEAKMAHLTPLHVEQMVVLDDLRVAGTPDLIATYRGRNYICDTKTGSIDYPHKMAAQLALYSRSLLYTPGNTQRRPLPDVDQERGIIIHLPAGEGRCDLHWVDLTVGWHAVELAVQVREYRTRKGILEPLDEVAEAVQTLTDAGLDPTVIVEELTLAESIQAMNSVEDLGRLWKDHQTEWTPEHTALAAARKAQLSAQPQEGARA